MYVPQSFRVTDRHTIVAFLERYDFATLVSPAADGPTATHVPLVLRGEPGHLVLVGHVARANPHWRAMDGIADALAIFHGPHGYVSPTWYAHAPAVPTWNYAVVHAYGKPRVRDEREFTEGVLRALVERHESGRAAPWRFEATPTEFRARLIAAIVAFEMPVERLEAKFKLGQNKPPEDRAGTLTGLDAEDSAEAAMLAEFTRRALETK